MAQHPVKVIVNPNADLGRAWHGAADLRPLYIHADGEIFAGRGMDVRQLSAEILPGEITVMV